MNSSTTASTGAITQESDTRSATHRIALVTGAASGIGKATARLLGARGMTVVCADLNEEGARATASDIKETGGSALGCQVDVSDQASVDSMAERVLAEVGTPWAVVNNAGFDEAMPFLETARPLWEKVVGINLLGPVAVSRALLPAMAAEGAGGRVVNVASDAGRVGSSGETVYAGAKGGVIAFSKSLAREVARYGITVNAVCPGPTDTPLFRAQPDNVQRALEKAIPFRRLATPGDIAAAIAFFASEEAGYITGQVLSVSGGLTMAG
jgi:2-hydroxycyclohexanecarboxyl-CoA dehydrogenase